MLQFDQDDNGFPILPIINIHEVVLRQVTELLQSYLSALWGELLSHHRFVFSSTLGLPECTYPPSTTFPMIPWAEISKIPADFIDTTHYSLPTALGSPIPCSPFDTLSLYDYLSKHQTLGDPFRFRTKFDIDERRRLAAEEAIMELSKDDEDLDDIGQSGEKPEVRLLTPFLSFC